MSETTPETPKGPEGGKTPEGGKGPKATGKENIFTKKYGPLSGWVWVIILGGTLYLVLTIKKKNAAANTSSATTTADTTTANGTGSDWGTSSDNGGSSGGYYGGSMPQGTLLPPIPNSGSATGSSPASPLFGVITTVDEQIAQNDGVPLSHLFVGAGTPKAGYTKPADLQTDPGVPGEIYLGQAGTGAPAGSTVLQGATRTETDQQLKTYLQNNPITTGT